MLLWAHRGGGKGTLENTLAGFELAVRRGFKAVEFDIMATRDGKLVLHHDFRLGRLSELNPESLHAHDSLLAALSEMELRDFKINKAQLLHFQEFAYFLFANQLQANVELKAQSPRAALELGRLTALLVDSLTGLEQAQVARDWVFSSFYHASLIPLEGWQRALLYEQLPDNWSIRANALQANAIHLHWTGATQEAVRRIHATGRKVRVYTVNEAGEAVRLQALGVSGLFTDRIEDVSNLLTSLNLNS
ncbi:MAG: glycerophosphodiester phosphodiesterase [Limnobacter sp.]|nr:glycerophosphodiester phosphodiesterase [Limnobacter sp.]